MGVVSKTKRLGLHAIVIGGGMAGLTTARVLADFFERVTLIERDRYPKQPVARSGVPQGRHVHHMLVRGQQVLEELFPGLNGKLLAQGATESDFVADYRTYITTGWLPHPTSSLHGYSCSRPLLEWQVRQEVISYPEVQIVEGYEVIGLLTSADNHTVIGIRMRKRQGATTLTGETISLKADFIVDSSGRDSHTLQWLQEAGYETPPEIIINPYLGYASRVYKPPIDPQRLWKGLSVQGNPPDNMRGGVLWTIENKQWMVVLAGAGKDYPPTDDAGFLEFAHGMTHLALYDALKSATPLTPIYGFRRTENRLRQFEKLSHHPGRLVLIGDAVCMFNPIYGQGMTAAALGAQALGQGLSKLHSSDELESFAQRFQRQLAHITALPWQLASASDQALADALGEKGALKKETLTTRATRHYQKRLASLLASDPQVVKRYSEVMHLIKPLYTLFLPDMLIKFVQQELHAVFRFLRSGDLLEVRKKAVS